eukprot:TRINITY_DN14284_c0_g1_i8.p1 TRINITY_DN14284_c0_g1~~TRINITY_DN14284_c0_g1_i8.p1  ORF type:complete len:469 (+),score=51.63 TRINITY_DN14284_c0_g1_i8:79-1485(+)
MEDKVICREHSKLLEMFCTDCSTLLCTSCINEHRKKGCKCPVNLATYAEEELLAKYKANLEELKRENNTIEKSVNTFNEQSRALRANLLELKIILEELLISVNAAIDLFNGNEGVFPPVVGIVEMCIRNQYEKLRTAVANEDAARIIDRVSSKAYVIGVDDNENKLVESINKAINDFMKGNRLQIMKNLIQEFGAKSRSFIDSFDSKNMCKFVYGICGPQSNNSVLCRYNILTKKLTPTVSVPLNCSVLQIERAVFVSGGYPHLVDALSEFIEETSTLIAKQPMLHPKWGHSMQALSRKAFATIGGCSDLTPISYCEEYSTAQNTWKALPSLTRADCYCGTALLANTFLYAIGGSKHRSTIEMLNMDERKEWVVVTPVTSEVMFTICSQAFEISGKEIVIVSGGIGVFDTEEKVVRKVSDLLKNDYYYYNSVCVINGVAYIIGGYGNIHIHHIAKKSFELIEYSSAIS